MWEWRKTKDGKAATQQQYEKKFGTGKRKSLNKNKKTTKKFRAKLAALEKKMEKNDAEKDKEEEVLMIAAVLKESNSQLASVSSTEEKNCSIARTVLGIIAREEKNK